MLIVREIVVLSFIVSEKNRKKDGRCIGLFSLQKVFVLTIILMQISLFFAD
jgi:hypothetical protein